MISSVKRVVPLLLVLALLISLGLSAHAKKKGTVAGTVNVNSASAEELVLVPGIGPSKAQAIIDFRAESRFEKTEDLMKVRGIGEKLFAKIQAYVTVDGPTTAKFIEDVSIDDVNTPAEGENS